MLGQIPKEKWMKVIEWLRFCARLPAIGLVIVGTALLSWLGFWFLIRLCMYTYTRWLDHPW